MTVSANAPNEREFFLDWLRILAFGVLVIYHVGMYYVSWDWHIKSPAAGAAIEPWMRLFAPWRMDLIFLVSGAATSMMLRRRADGRGLPAERARRLLPPLLLGVFVVVPPQSYFEVVQRFRFDAGYGEFMLRYLTGYNGFCAAPGHCLILPTWNHLWYLPYLLCYTLVLWGLVCWRPGLPERLAQRLIALPGRGWLLVGPFVFLLLTRALLREHFPVTRALVDDWFMHAQYFGVFFLGVVLARAPRAWQQLADARWSALLIALAAWALLTAATGRVLPAGAPIVAALSSFDGPLLRSMLVSAQQWGAIVAALGFGWRHLRRDGPARRYLTDAVFPVYVLHQTVIIVLAVWLAPLALAAPIEAVLLSAATLAVCLAGFEIVRRVDWLRPWFGLKRLDPQPAAQRVAAW